MNDSYEILSLSAFQNKYDICMQDELIWASKVHHVKYGQVRLLVLRSAVAFFTPAPAVKNALADDLS